MGVPIPAQGCVPVIGRGAHPSRVRVPEVEPAVIAAAGAPTDGSRIAVVACRRDPHAAKPGIKGRVAPGDLGCRGKFTQIERIVDECGFCDQSARDLSLQRMVDPNR